MREGEVKKSTRDLNQVTLLGNVGQDPQIVVVGNDRIMKFSVATNEPWTNSKGEQHVEWHYVSARMNDNIESQKIQKGTRVLVTGRIKTSKWESDGEKKSKTEIIASEVGIVRQSQSSSSKSIDDEIPF